MYLIMSKRKFTKIEIQRNASQTNTIRPSMNLIVKHSCKDLSEYHIQYYYTQ